MKQPTYILENCTRIRTHTKLGSEKGMMIAPKYLANRKPDLVGEIFGVVGGHGGDVYWVKHKTEDDSLFGAQAAYCFDEFELEE